MSQRIKRRCSLCSAEFEFKGVKTSLRFFCNQGIWYAHIAFAWYICSKVL